MFRLFFKSVEKIRFINSRQEWRVLYKQRVLHLWPLLVKFFSEWDMFSIKVVEKIKTHILCSITFFRKSWRLWDNIEKSTWSQKRHKWRHNMAHRVACKISNATRAHSHSHAHALRHPHACARTHRQIRTSNTRIAFPRQQWFANAPQCYVTRILPILCLNAAGNVPST
jgi:hypothetical protein